MISYHATYYPTSYLSYHINCYYIISLVADTNRAAKAKFDWTEKKRVQYRTGYETKKFDSNLYRNTDEYLGIEDDRVYYKGWSYAPPNVTAATLPLYFPVTDSDMAFNKSAISGQLFYRTIHDANRHIHIVLAGHVVGNEDYLSHAIFDQATIDRYGDAYNHNKMIDILDGEKGSTKSCKQILTNILPFTCVKHGVAMVLRNGSKADSQLYSEARKAATTEAVRDLTERFSKAGKRMIAPENRNSIPLKSLFPAEAKAAGYFLRGRSASQSVEGFNSATALVRSLEPAQALLELSM
jgi:hypothetical protein